MHRLTCRRALAVTATSALLLTACGGADGSDDSPDDATAPDESAGAEATGGDEEWPEQLTLAVVPAEGAEGLLDGYGPMIALLEDELGIDIELQEATGNAAVIEAQIAERADLAMYGAFSYYLARAHADIEPLVASQRAPETEPGVQAYAVVPAGSDIQSLEDAAGRNICFTDAASTSGYLAPLAGLLDAGVDPDADAQVVYAGGHDSAVISVLSGDCDIAFAADMFINVLLPSQGVFEEGDLDIIWESPLIPEPPLAAGRWLPDDLRERIQSILTGTNAVEMAANGYCEGDAVYEAPGPFGDTAGEDACLLALQQAYGFVAVDDDSYQPIADICETTEADVCQAGA